MCLTRQTHRASMLFRFKCLISSVLGTLLFNLQQHFTLQANACWVVAGVNTTLETRGLVTSCCTGAQRGVHGFAQGQRQWNALVGADAHPFGFLMWPCKNNTADILQDCYAGCELTPLVCLGWPWLVLICSKMSGGPAQLKYARGRSSSDAFAAVALIFWVTISEADDREGGCVCNVFAFLCFLCSTIIHHNERNKCQKQNKTQYHTLFKQKQEWETDPDYLTYWEIVSPFTWKYICSVHLYLSKAAKYSFNLYSSLQILT